MRIWRLKWKLKTKKRVSSRHYLENVHPMTVAVVVAVILQLKKYRTILLKLRKQSSIQVKKTILIKINIVTTD